MKRVVQPLVQMGADIHASSCGHLPISMQGCRHPKSILYKLPFPSAQVKSAILLAGLHAPGSTIVIEPHATRDHTEKLLSHFGAIVETEELHGGGSIITIRGEQELVGNDVVVPGDISSAAFPLVACLVVPESKILLKGVGVNPRRAGIIQTLRDMGADIVEQNRREEGREPIADLLVQSSSLYATEVPISRVPSMIDEFPVLAVAAAYARGKTRMSGLSELRVKESDRLSAIVRGLTACGIKVDAGPGSLEIEGVGGQLPGGGIVNVNFDHRIAMAFLVFGLASCSPVEIDDIDAIQTSFPDFLQEMRKIGASFEMNQGRYENL